MEEIVINIGWIKHGLWILFTLVWLGFNIFRKKEPSGYLSGIGDLVIFGISTLIYMAFWIIWLIIF